MRRFAWNLVLAIVALGFLGRLKCWAWNFLPAGPPATAGLPAFVGLPAIFALPTPEGLPAPDGWPVIFALPAPDGPPTVVGLPAPFPAGCETCPACAAFFFDFSSFFFPCSSPSATHASARLQIKTRNVLISFFLLGC